MGQQFSLLAAYGVKVAIVVYFYSLNPSPKLQVATVITGVVTLIAGIASQVYELLLCRPISYYWLRAAPHSNLKGSCLPTDKAIAIWQTLNTMCILLDVTLALLPCIMVWNMQMKRSSKICVAFLLGPGGLYGRWDHALLPQALIGKRPAVAAILRSIYYAKLSTHTSQVTCKSIWFDMPQKLSSWLNLDTQIPMRLTKVVEISIPIIVVCIARLRPLVQKIVSQSWFPSSRGKPEVENLTIGRLRGRPHDPSNVSELSFYGRLDSATQIEQKPKDQVP